MGVEPDHVAVLVVRAWRDGDRPGDLRARITWVDDVRSSEQQSTAAAGPEAVVAVVRRWLEELAAAP